MGSYISSTPVEQEWSLKVSISPTIYYTVNANSTTLTKVAGPPEGAVTYEVHPTTGKQYLITGSQSVDVGTDGDLAQVAASINRMIASLQTYVSVTTIPIID